MGDDVLLFLISGIYGLIDDLRSNVDAIDRAGQEAQLYKDRIFKGRLSHFSVASKKNLEKELISAIMSLDGKLRRNERPKGSVLLLRNRKKRFKN